MYHEFMAMFFTIVLSTVIVTLPYFRREFYQVLPWFISQIKTIPKRTNKKLDIQIGVEDIQHIIDR